MKVSKGLSNLKDEVASYSRCGAVYSFLCMLCLTSILGTYVLVYKWISIFGFTQSAGVWLFPISYFIADVVTEVYGPKAARNMVIMCLICAFLFSLGVSSLSRLSGSNSKQYIYVLGSIIQFDIGITFGLLVGALVNIRLMAYLRLFGGLKKFWLRSIISTAIGELVTSCLSEFISFWGHTNISGIFELMFMIYLFKMFYAAILSMVGGNAVSLVKLIEVNLHKKR